MCKHLFAVALLAPAWITLAVQHTLPAQMQGWVNTKGEFSSKRAGRPRQIRKQDRTQANVRFLSARTGKPLQSHPSSSKPRTAYTPPIVQQFGETSFYLKDLTMIDANTGWAVGDPHWDQNQKTYPGTIVRTTDGGQTWTAQEAGTAEFLTGVSFVDVNQGWVVGTNGTIVHTTDGGARWVKQTVGTTDDFGGVTFVDANTGWATTTRPVHYDDFGNEDDWTAAIWSTRDGGNTWIEQAVPDNASILKRIDFVDSQTGWAVGAKLTQYLDDGPHLAGVVYNTTDGGSTWSEQYSPELPMTFTALDFVDAMNGWVVGFITDSGVAGGSVFHTADGGKTWDRQKSAAPLFTDIGGWLDNLWQVKFFDSSRGYAVGTLYGAAWGPPVWRTMDGGATWEIINMASNDDEGLFGVAVAENQVVAVGDHDFLATSSTPWAPGASEFSCFNNACLFTQTYLTTHYVFHDVFFIDQNHGCAVGSETLEVQVWGQIILCTQDGGLIWKTQYEHAQGPESISFDHSVDRVQFVDSSNGWAVGRSETEYVDNPQGPGAWETYGAILHTSDGGLTWNDQGTDLSVPSGDNNFTIEFGAVAFLNIQTGWALLPLSGNDNVWFAHTTDGGNHWNWMDTGIQGEGLGGAAPGMTDIFGDYVNPMGDIEVRGQNVWAAGSSQSGTGAAAIYSVDGGAHWAESEFSCPPYGSDCGTRIYRMAFVSNQEGWLVGGESGVAFYHTTNGGQLWSRHDLPEERFGDLQAVQFPDAQHGWAAGQVGNLLRSTDGGSTWEYVAAGTGADLLGLSFLTPQLGWIVGGSGTILNYVGNRIPAGTPAVSGVTNGASFLPGIAPNTWISVFGVNLAGSTRSWTLADFNGNELPTQLDGVGVNVNGQPAYVYYISASQLNVLAPQDTAAGPVSVQVVTPQGTSDPLMVPEGPYSPALFHLYVESGQYVIAQTTDGMLVGNYNVGWDLGTPTQVRDAHPGDIVTLYGTGFGPTKPPLSIGTLVNQPAVLAAPVTFYLGRTKATVLWAGLIESGLYQFNIQIPNVPNGDEVIVAEIGGYRSQSDSLISVAQQ